MTTEITTPAREETTTSGNGDRGAALFEWLSDNVRWVTIAIAIVTVAAAPLAASRTTEESDFSPSGEIHETFELVDERFASASPIAGAFFIVEATEGAQPDALTRDVLLEFMQNSDAMLLALPVALVLCTLLAAVFMRSLKYGLASVAPTLLVVGGCMGSCSWPTTRSTWSPPPSPSPSPSVSASTTRLTSP